MNIRKFDTRLADELIRNPDLVMSHARDALTLIDLPVKSQVDARIRVSGLPRKTQIRYIRSSDVNQLISVDGTVRKITDVRPRVMEAAFECARCKNILYIPQEGSGKFIEPAYCQCNDDKKGVFRLLYKDSMFEDFQRVKIQESPENLKGGEQPQTLDINVSDDLAGLVVPGEPVVINGILRSVQRITKDGKTVYFDIYMDAVMVERQEQEFDEVEITPDDEKEILKLSEDEEIYKKISGSIAPSIYGFQDVKEAISYQLFGGITKSMPDGTRLRGDINVLLVGDPGIAKSQILRYVVKLAPRAEYASGKSSSGAGLTAAAVKDPFDGAWTLEAGTVVLADKGLAALDELDKMHPDDRSSLHECMEQGSITVAKAGIQATLMARVSVLGAANPKNGRFDPYESIPEQINMPPSLMSRFDLVYVLRDIPEEKRDLNTARHIVRSHKAGEMMVQKKNLRSCSIKDEDIEAAITTVKPAIDTVMLKKYIAYAKRKCFPLLSKDAEDRLIEFYTGLRKNGDGDKEPIKIGARQLEGLIRLTEARARMRLSNVATIEDAVEVIRIVEVSLSQSSTDRETGQQDINIFTAGVSKSQRDRIKDLTTIIEELGGKDSPVEVIEVVKKAGERGLKEARVMKELDKLKQIGEIYEARPGCIMIAGD
ncbi:minichromosome maintenance protein MCM [Methanocella sp. MCL-LM]|uniref:minichromosome maintenance protein MCM n=1 Tax=Methanocella sp. MCL-LM TaxID=3412035 RepID=UPI003C7799AF